MKNFVKYGLLVLGGYLIGVYEMKYKTQKALLNIIIDKEKEKLEKEEEP